MKSRMPALDWKEEAILRIERSWQQGVSLLILTTLTPPMGNLANTSACSCRSKQLDREREVGTYPLVLQSRMRETTTVRIAQRARMTAGLFVCAKGHHVNGDALDIIKSSREKKEQERLVKENKKRNECEDIKHKFGGALAKGVDPSIMNVSDLKVMVQWFKLPSDPDIPARKQDLIE
jgi:hypothetical protein